MEIERRPHWSDDLIDAVIRAESDAHDYEYRAMAAIAAVEDWHESKGWLLVGMIHEQRDRAEEAEAQVQRAREVHQAVVDDEDDPWQVAYATGWDEALQEVRRALDGDSQ